MPVPETPDDFKAYIPKAGGNFCEKFVKALGFPKSIWKFTSWMWNEDGTLSDNFRNEACQQACFGGITVFPRDTAGSPSRFGIPDNVIASKGQFNNKIRLTWTPVEGAVYYELWRGSTSEFAQATLIKQVGPNHFHDDTTALASRNYHYWVTAVPQSGEPTLPSRPSVGYRTEQLASVSTLAAWKGMHAGNLNHLSLYWTAPAGISIWDIYRSEVDDFATADLIDENRRAFDNSRSREALCKIQPCVRPLFVNNGTDLTYMVLLDRSEREKKYYFWVVGKTLDGDVVLGVGSESNSALGWGAAWADGTAAKGSEEIRPGSEWTVPTGVTECWVALHGAGAGGAGGGVSFGGGGGGGPGIISGRFPVTAGAKLRITETPGGATTNAAPTTNGANGSKSDLEYSALGNWTDTVKLYEIPAPAGGQYNAGGGGLGGAGATGLSVHASVSDATMLDGNDGEAGSGATGGRSGYSRGGTRIAPAHFDGRGGFDGNSHSDRGAGAGSASVGVAHSSGGAGQEGVANIWYR